MIGLRSVTDERTITKKGERRPILMWKIMQMRKTVDGIIMEIMGHIASAKSALWISACSCFVLERIDARMARNLHITWYSLQNIQAYTDITTAVYRPMYG